MSLTNGDWNQHSTDLRKERPMSKPHGESDRDSPKHENEEKLDNDKGIDQLSIDDVIVQYYEWIVLFTRKMGEFDSR